MTLEEAIKRYTSNAFYEKSDGNLQGYLEFNQLAEWLKDYKRLLEQEPVCIGKVEFDEDKLREIVKEQISLIAIQEPCEDLISRADAIDACDQSINLLEAVDRIKELPRK